MTIKLDAKTRTVSGKDVVALREQGKIPAVLYGHGFANQNLELDYNSFEKAFYEAGESTIIDLSIDGTSVAKTLIAEVQYEPVKHRFSHVDFHQVKMDEKINAMVAIKFIGESKAIKEDGGVLVHNLSELKINCLPDQLIHEIDVDISILKTFDDEITIKDLNLPKSVEVIGHEETEVLVKVMAPKKEEPVVVATAPTPTAEAGKEASTEVKK
ncbi:MAG: 50S ribosomal protein L25 [bacterium]